MDREEFLNTVADRAALPTSEHAARITDTVLGTLGNRVTTGQALDLAARLPVGLGGTLAGASDAAGSFGRDEFLTRIAEHEGTDQDTAEGYARAVLHTLRDVVPEGEVADTFAQLPHELYALFG